MEYSKLRSGDTTYLQHRWEAPHWYSGDASCCRTSYSNLGLVAGRTVGFTRWDGIACHRRKL